MIKADIFSRPGMDVPFPSLAEMKAAHSELLKLHHQFLESQPDGEETEALPEELLIKITEFISRGQATGAIVDEVADRWDSQGLLDYWTTILYRAGLYREDEKSFRASLIEFDPNRAPKLDESLCPYLGLDAFQEDDRKYFFGRNHLVAEMVNCLEANRLLAAIGPSGCGKSSLILAGVLPALKSGALPGSQNWRYYPNIVPGADPLASLALLLKPPDQARDAWINSQVKAFKDDSDHLLNLVSDGRDEPVVIVVDQFEEAFTLCNDNVALEALGNNLANLVEGGKHKVMLTIRSEFESKMPRLQKLYPIFKSGRFHVIPLSATELRDAIEKPAEIAGLKFQAGIVDSLVKEILGEPAGLPLLQFTLLELWRSRERNRVTWDAYNKLGGAREALTRSADRLYNHLIPQEQETLRRILVRLGWADEGVEVLRNRVSREILHRVGGAPDRVNSVLDKLVTARLLHLIKDDLSPEGKESGNDQFEVAHEALIRNWRTLGRFLDEERNTLRQRLRLKAAAEQWEAHSYDPGGLLGGSLLEEARHYNDLSPLEERFVKASREAIEKAEKAKVEAYQQRIALQARAARRLKWMIAGLSLMFLIALATTALALNQRRIAEENERKATQSAQEAKAQRGKAEENEKLATANAAEAEKLKLEADEAKALAIKAAERAKLEAIRANEERKRAEEFAKLAEAEAAKTRAEAAKTKEVTHQLVLALDRAMAQKEVLEISHRELEERGEQLKEALSQKAAEQEKTEQTLKTLLEGQKEKNILNSELSKRLQKAEALAGTHTVFSPDSSMILTLSSDAKARLWNTKLDGSPQVLASEYAITQIAFDPSGKSIATVNEKGRIEIWDPRTAKIKGSILVSGSGVTKIAFSPDSRRLAVADDKGRSQVFDLNTKRRLNDLSAAGAAIVDIDFSPDGKYLVATDQDKQTRLWKIAPGVITAQSLSDESCAPQRVQALSIKPTPDLGAEIVIERTCIGSGVSRAEIPASKGLTEEQAAVLTEKVHPAARPSVPTQSPQPDQPTKVAVPTQPTNVNIPRGTSQLTQWSIKIRLYRTVGTNNVDILDMSTTAQVEKDASDLGKLAREMLSEKQINNISDEIYKYAKSIEGLDDTEALKGATILLPKIFAILNLSSSSQMAESLAGSLATMRSALMLTYLMGDPHFINIAEHLLPKVPGALDGVKTAVQKAQNARPGQLTQEFADCLDKIDDAMSMANDATDQSGSADKSFEKYGLVKRLLSASSEFDEDTLRNVIACVTALNRSLHDPAITAAIGALESVRIVMEAEFQQIDEATARRRAEADVPLPRF